MVTTTNASSSLVVTMAVKLIARILIIPHQVINVHATHTCCTPHAVMQWYITSCMCEHKWLQTRVYSLC